MAWNTGIGPGGKRNRKAREAEPVGGYIAALVASAFCVRQADLCTAGRGRAPAAFARQVAMYLCKSCLSLTYQETGRLFGRDRTTAAHACRMIEEKREDANFDTIIDCLERAIGLWPRNGNASGLKSR